MTSTKRSLRVVRLLVGLLLMVSATAFSQEAVPFTPRLDGGNIEIRGDILFVGNNILNRASQSNPAQANTPYNGTANNNSLWMEYIDIDGDPSTFSSSSAELNVPDAACSQVRYAGLYWASTYPNERSTNGGRPFDGTPRFEDWNQVRFRMPGGSYIDLTADNNPDPVGEEDDIIFDGYDPVNINNSFKDSPIICYKNVTGLVQSLADPNGEYTVANIRATKGRRQGSSSAGWVLVIIYENPNETGKFISTFDGYAGVQGSVPAVNVDVNGFRTLPTGFPVRARIGVAALEGDRGIRNDRFRIRANSVGGFTDLTTGLNPANNFFNSTITNNGAEVPTRTPFGTNTLGLDLDVFNLDNPLNSVLPNDETGATLQFTSSGDGYGAFLTTFSVEIIEPEINLEKRVEDIAGNDITGMGVNLGQYIDYILRFQNIGNDDAINYTIRDILPANVTLDQSNITMPPGVTYTFDAALDEITFTIPDNLVEEDDPVYEIRMRVRVAENCFDFVNACSDEIQNQAFSTYQGNLNSAQITDDPSVSDFDACGFVTPGATNFLLDDLENCDFARTVELCGNDVLLVAGDNFDDYIWYRDNNGDGLIDPGDTTITDGDPDGDPSTLRVTEVGTYIVDKIVADPCKGFQEIITVVLPGVTQTNPIVDLINDPTNTVEGEVVACPNDGEPLPKIFLCGANDTELIEINIPDATSIQWEQLDEASCLDAGEDCANKNSACTWNNVGSGFNFLAADPGEYRVVVNYLNGCFTRFYFNIFQNPLDPQYNLRDIICSTPGNITVTNVPADYEFQLLDATNGNVLVPFSAGNGPSFDIATNGAYTIEMQQVGVTGGCLFRLENIGVRERDFQVDVTAQDASCNGLGSIRVSVLDVEPQYYFEISQGGSPVDTFGPSVDNNYTFQNLNPGTYDVRVTTDDGCVYTEQVEILDQANLEATAAVLQSISCAPGIIGITATGGAPAYTYAVWSFTDEGGITQISYADPTDIPAGEFQADPNFPITDAGTYEFVVVDSNNCYDISNAVVLTTVPAITYDPATVADVSCFGLSDGSITFNLTGAGGYAITYFLLDDAGVEIASNASGTFTGLPPGDYSIRVNQVLGADSCDIIEDYTVSGPAQALAADAVLTQPFTCLQTGIVEAQNVAGGTAPYQYSIDGLNFGPSNTFAGLSPGTYAITVRDAAGCTFVTAPVTLAPMDPPTDISFSATAPNCPALTSEVTLSVTGGLGAITYEIIAPSPVNNGNNNAFPGLSPDTYTFRVTDANGCAYEESLTINPVAPIQVTGALLQNVSCLGGTDGASEFSVSGFSGTYAYSVNGGAPLTGQSANTINLTGLAAGNYTVEVTDETTSCTDTAVVAVTEPAAPLSVAFVTTPLTCAAPGAVTVTASGGWGSYSYELEQPDATVLGPQGSGTFANLSQTGTYTIRVTDANGCVATAPFDLLAPTNPVASIDPASGLCYESTGLATVAVGTTGGLAPYFYSVNGGPTQASNTFSGLVPGTYTFTVLDSNGCTDTVSQVIEPELTANAVLTKDLDCSVSPDAIIGLTPSGGYPPYTYEVRINGGGYASYAGGFPYTTGVAGTYQFRVTDSQGCEAVSNIITVNPAIPPQASATAQDPTCNGDSNGFVEIDIDPNFGQAPFEVDFNGLGYSLQTVYTNLPAGTYSYTVRDAKDCVFTDTITLNDPPLFDAAISVTDVSCGGAGIGDIPGRIDVSITSGGVPNFTYTLYDQLNNVVPTTGPNPIVNTPSTSVSFDGLDFGDYYVRIVDANGCEFYQNPVRVFANPYLTLTSAPPVVDCATGGTVVLSADGGSGNYSFAIFGSGVGPTTEVAGPGPNEETATFTGLNAGQTYIFEAVDNATNCTSYWEVDITSPSGIDVVGTPVVTDASCFGASDGEITFQVEGYDPSVTDITYRVLERLTNNPLGAAYEGTVTQAAGGPTPTPAVTIPNIPPGDYVLYFEEVTSPFCSNTHEFRILEPTPIVLDLLDQNNANCNQDAQVTVLATGGTGPLSYAFVPDGTAPGGFTASNYAELDPAVSLDWDVYAMDASGCITPPLDIAIAADPASMISAVVANQCTVGEGDFEIEVTLATAGVGPYLLSLDGGAFQSSTLAAAGDTFSFSGLSSGMHTVSLLDGNGCGNTINLEIFSPSSMIAEAQVQPTCALNDGEILITPSGGSGTYTYELFLGGVSVTGGPQPTPNFSGLAPGSYTAFVYDGLIAGCGASASIDLEVPTLVSFTANSTDVTCNGGSDGTITATLDPGMDNPPYTYQLFDSTGLVPQGPVQTSPGFTGLPAADYIVRVTSGRACTADILVTIGEPPLLTAAAAASDFFCHPDNSVSESVITVTAGGGTAPYLYSLDGVNFVSSNTFDIADTGVAQPFTVTVRDANGCVATDAITINPLPQLTDLDAAQVTAISCLGDEVVRLTVTGGSGDFDFDLLPMGSATQSPGAGVFTADFTLSAPGDYTFRVTDNVTGCTITSAPYTIVPFDLIDVLATVVTPVNCFGDSSGAIEFQVNDYAGNYTYQVFDQGGAAVTAALAGDTSVNPRTVSGLPAGNFRVRVIATDAPFCQEDSNTFTIPSPDMPVTAAISQIASVTCTDDQGEILVAPEGGYGPYDILLVNTTTGQNYAVSDVSDHVFAGLSAGNFTVAVTDDAGCVFNDAITLVAPLPITADIDAAPATLACFGDENAIVSAINTTGGQGSYTYQLNSYDAAGTSIVFTSGGQASPVFENLGAGVYSITVTDGWNCGTETAQVVISEPAEVFSSLVQATQMTCNTGAELILTASGGTAPYTYSADGLAYQPMSGGDTHTFSVADGTYQYYVRDAFGCEASLSNQVSVEPVPPLEIVVDETAAVINCTGEATASLTATATGGLGNYQYELYGDASLSVLLVGPQGDGLFAGLASGSYWIRATSVDCEAVTSELIIDEPVPLQIDREAFTDVTCAGEADGTITVEVSGGTGNIVYAITPNLNQFDTKNTFTGLDVGVYDVIAQDENGCFIPFQFTITEPQPLEATAVSTPEICAESADGTVEITITGGTAPYQTAFNSNSDADFVAGQTLFAGLSAGTYAVFVRDAQGCETNVIVEVAPGVNLNAQVTPVYECTDILPENYLEVVLEDPSVADEVMYALDSTDPAAMQLDADFRNIAPGPHYLAISHTNGCVVTIDFEIQAFEPLALALEQRNINEITAIATGGQPEYTFYFNGEDSGTDNTYYINQTGTYTVQVVDQNGCMAEAQIFMEFIDIEIPNFFTPDGDGMNDLWIPENLEGFPQILIIVYDRYGRVVDELIYGSQGWDGTYDGRELPSGDYWYSLQINGENDTREFVGHFTLYR